MSLARLVVFEIAYGSAAVEGAAQMENCARLEWIRAHGRLPCDVSRRADRPLAGARWR